MTSFWSIARSRPRRLRSSTTSTSLRNWSKYAIFYNPSSRKCYRRPKIKSTTGFASLKKCPITLQKKKKKKFGKKVRSNRLSIIIENRHHRSITKLWSFPRRGNSCSLSTPARSRRKPIRRSLTELWARVKRLRSKAASPKEWSKSTSKKCKMPSRSRSGRRETKVLSFYI